MSWYLSHHQAEMLMDAAGRALALGLAFNRHWTIHYERAGIPDAEGMAFVSGVLQRARRFASQAGGEFAAIWVRENGKGKGAHVHIALHIPEGLTLRHRTRQWIKAAGGTYRRRVSKVRSIAGTLQASEHGGAHYEANLLSLVRYLAKGVKADIGAGLGLESCGFGGPVIGKRAGRTQNLRHYGGSKRNNSRVA